MISQQTQDKAYGVFKSLASRAKQYAMNLSEIELKTEEATNNEAWGPTGSQMSGRVLTTFAVLQLRESLAGNGTGLLHAAVLWQGSVVVLLFSTSLLV